MRRRCLLDVDGVLADFVGAACRVHGKVRDEVYPPGEQKDYRIEKHMGISATEFWRPFDAPFWESLEKTLEADVVVEVVERFFGPENVCLLTSPPLNHEAIVGKMRWVEKHFPGYRRRFLIGPRKEFCAHPLSVLVDDSDHNVDTFRSAGGRAVLVPGPWNTASSRQPEIEAYAAWLASELEEVFAR